MALRRAVLPHDARTRPVPAARVRLTPFSKAVRRSQPAVGCRTGRRGEARAGVLPAPHQAGVRGGQRPRYYDRHGRMRSTHPGKHRTVIVPACATEMLNGRRLGENETRTGLDIGFLRTAGHGARARWSNARLQCHPPVAALTGGGRPAVRRSGACRPRGLWQFRGMTEWLTPGIPGVPRMPDPAHLLAQYQAQAEALAQLTPTIVALNQALRGLTGVVETARDTVDSAQRVTAQLERIVSELEGPARALRPGLERVAQVLDDPAVAALPDTLRRVQDSLLPLLEGVARAQTRIGHLAAAATQSFVRLTAPRRADDGADDPGTRPGD